MEKMIADYYLFTLARSEGRVPMLSTTEASRIRQKQFHRCFQTLDDEEKSRTWRGFLIYDLLCMMHGVPCIAAAARDRVYLTPNKLLTTREVFRRVPTYIQEEVLCVWQYVQEQYDLAFNSLLESFELAVGELGRRAPGTSTSPSTHVQPIIDLQGTDESPVKHLFEPPDYQSNTWTNHVSMLGVMFLQRFLAWDSSTRLDFIRITYPFLSNIGRFSTSGFLRPEFQVERLIEENLGWPNHCMDESKLGILRSLCKKRLRAVGWIFWKKPPRLFATDSNERSPYRTTRSNIRPHLRLQGRPHLEEIPVKEQEWGRIVRHYAPSFSERQLNDIKALFTSIGTLECGRIADIVSALQPQDKDQAPTEVKEGGN